MLDYALLDPTSQRSDSIKCKCTISSSPDKPRPALLVTDSLKWNRSLQRVLQEDMAARRWQPGRGVGKGGAKCYVE
jgi:hypothetical protein